jgi:hypothetical protein
VRSKVLKWVKWPQSYQLKSELATDQMCFQIWTDFIDDKTFGLINTSNISKKKLQDANIALVSDGLKANSWKAVSYLYSPNNA